MTPDLTYLTLTAGLCMILWIPYIGYFLLRQGGLPPAAEYAKPVPRDTMPQWWHRSQRAHLNLVESVGPFAALVLVAHVAGQANAATATAAAVFFWARVIQAAVHIAGVPYGRTIAFVVSWAAAIVIFYQIVT